MKYFSFGNGKTPLVILPGADIKSILEAKDAVTAMYADFTADYTVYVFDITCGAVKGTTVADMAEDTAAKMAELGIKDACVLACSLGGMTALFIAGRHPELIGKLVLASSAPSVNDMSRRTFTRWRELTRAGDAAALYDDFAEAIYSAASQPAVKSAFSQLAKTVTEAELEHFEYVTDALLSYDSLDMPEKLRCTTAVVGAWEDNTLSVDASVELARRIGCELHVFPRYGHAIYDEAPGFMKCLADFFKGEGSWDM